MAGRTVRVADPYIGGEKGFDALFCDGLLRAVQGPSPTILNRTGLWRQLAYPGDKAHRV